MSELAQHFGLVYSTANAKMVDRGRSQCPLPLVRSSFFTCFISTKTATRENEDKTSVPTNL